jgi:hypothetical protein
LSESAAHGDDYTTATRGEPASSAASMYDRPLPRGGASLRFWVEPLGPHTQRFPRSEAQGGGDHVERCEHGRQDLVDCLPHCRWAMIGPGPVIRGFRTVAEFKAYCLEHFGVTEWERGWTGDWTPQDGDSWIGSKGELWPGRA